MESVLIISGLAPHLGVQIDGLDLAMPVIDSTARELRGLLDRHKLLLMRDVPEFTDIQRRLLGIFGTVLDEKENGEFYSIVDNRAPGSEDSGEELIYHADYSFLPDPLPYVSLYGLKIPDGSAVTRFANGVRAAATMPQDLAARLEGRRILHASDVLTGTQESSGQLTSEQIEAGNYSGTFHPAIYAHPRTGEPIFFINQYLCLAVEGLDADAGSALLLQANAHVQKPEDTYVHDWRPGDIIVFDNIALQHKREVGRPRTLRRMIANA